MQGDVIWLCFYGTMTEMVHAPTEGAARDKVRERYEKYGIRVGNEEISVRAPVPEDAGWMADAGFLV